ncbi:MAG: molybdopterin molybdotransferase MoeA [Selenomonadaceae bacterium]|nr:molybdopterin molybdotransferase MoeA [Selenomonadaceae bacterium]
MEGVTLEQATQILIANTAEILDIESVPLLEALGRVTAEDFFATLNNPPFDRSPLDGYALRSADTFGATPATPKKFKVVGEECAGDFFAQEIECGEALRIMTGAAMPKGSDCVIRQEDVTTYGDDVFVPYALRAYENYCFAGEDIKAGQLLVKGKTKLRSAHIAIFAAQGASKIKCFRQPRITFATTGNELQSVEDHPIDLEPVNTMQSVGSSKLRHGKATDFNGNPSRCDSRTAVVNLGTRCKAAIASHFVPTTIYNSNLYLIASRLKELGFEANILGNLPDDADECAKRILMHQNETDLLITTGGVSVGKKDIMHEVVRKLGTRLFWRVEMKPGAPAIGWKGNGFIGIALSGNPFAALATFELLARPVLAKLSHNDELRCRRKRGILVNGFKKSSPGRRIIRAHVDDGRVYLPERHESGVLYSAIDCNAFVDIPAGSKELSAGEEVEIILL